MDVIRVMIIGLTILVLPARAGAADEWSFRLIPYVWMSGLSGDVATLPGAPEADIDMSFTDILENLDFAAFVVGEARHGDLFLRGEVSYAKISDGAATPGPLFSGADVTAETFFGGLAAGYTIIRGPAHQVDAFAGFRYWVIDTDLDLSGGVLPAQSVSETESFVDPLVGLSLEWGVTTGVTYHAGENWGVIVGYRYLAVDYDHGDFVYDVAQHGPFLGAVFDF
jgi:hypothetical protein